MVSQQRWHPMFGEMGIFILLNRGPSSWHGAACDRERCRERQGVFSHSWVWGLRIDAGEHVWVWQEASCKNHRVNRVVFLGSTKRLLTTGVSRWNTRQIALWDQVGARTPTPSPLGPVLSTSTSWLIKRFVFSCWAGRSVHAPDRGGDRWALGSPLPILRC